MAPPVGLIQRPPRWLINALGILVGDNPQRLDPTVYPMLDVMQQGLGQGVWSQGVLNGSTGGPVTLNNLASPDIALGKWCWLLKWSCYNPGTALVLADCYTTLFNSGVPGPLEYSRTIPIGGNLSWADFNSGRQFLFIPPGFEVVFNLATFTTTAGLLRWQLGQFPAGTKPF